ncbi:14-3-3 domain-containing protein [Baffinella frigidus]|nr:14-3-3 domain-containing protein [Cryptophyta sp. CCMP2293]
MGEREELVFSAQLSETAERYDEMRDTMKEVVDLAAGNLTEEERNLLGACFKHCVSSRRTTARMIASMEKKQPDESNKNKIKDFRSKVELELTAICEDILAILDAKLLPAASAVDAKVFYQKMKGDYLRYLAEIAGADQKKAVAAKCGDAYAEAQETAKTLSTTSALRLGLSLNQSVFFFEIQEDADAACAASKKAFEDATADLEEVASSSFEGGVEVSSVLDSSEYKKSTEILQLLRDNLTLWTSGDKPASESEPEGYK